MVFVWDLRSVGLVVFIGLLLLWYLYNCVRILINTIKSKFKNKKKKETDDEETN